MDRRTRIERFVGLLEKLIDLSDFHWERANRDPEYTQICKLKDEIQGKVYPLSGDRLWEKLVDLEEGIVKVGTERPIYLPPFRDGEEDYIGLLSLHWQFSGADERWDPPENGLQSLRVHMIRVAEEPGERGRYRSICFHLDGWNDTPGFRYYHLQVCERTTPSFEGWGYKENPGWSPEEEPRFPLPADTPVELLLSLCNSFYGMNTGVSEELMRRFKHLPGDDRLRFLEGVLKRENKRSGDGESIGPG